MTARTCLFVLPLLLARPVYAETMSECVDACREKTAGSPDRAAFKTCALACRDSATPDAPAAPAPAPAERTVESIDPNFRLRWHATVSQEGAFDEVVNAVAPLPDGGGLAVGQSFELGPDLASHYDQLLLARVDSKGALAWRKAVPAAGDWEGLGATVLPSGVPVVVGSKDTDGTPDLWAAALRDDGSFLWEQSWSRTQSDALQAVVADGDGLLVVGNLGDSSAAGRHPWIARLGADGALQWERELKPEVPVTCENAVSDGQGGLLLVGYSGNYAMEQRAFVAAVDASGTERWHKLLGGKDDRLSGATPAGPGWLVVGTARSQGAGGGDAWVAQLDAAGNVQWEKTYGGAGEDSGLTVLPQADGAYTLVGTASSFSEFVIRGVFAMGISPDRGARIWLEAPSFASDHVALDARRMANGDLLIGGAEAVFGTAPGEGVKDNDGYVVQLGLGPGALK
jgi:hypothetical protein